MFTRLEKLEARYQELEELLISPEVLSNQEQCGRLAKELSGIREPVYLFREHKRLTKELEDLEIVLGENHDKEFLDLAKRELEELV
ncbi:MAG: PCRF domain-containing protein, partial [Candidatus Omnitrophica bacterium]|nr:PCRF domain-containing protein [Candidatus Omnitrophota bacterium]